MAPAMATCGAARAAAAPQSGHPRTSHGGPQARTGFYPLPFPLQFQCGARPRAVAVSSSPARTACGATPMGALALPRHQGHRRRVQRTCVPGSSRRRLTVASSAAESGARTDCRISLGTAVIPADVDLQALESVLYKVRSTCCAPIPGPPPYSPHLPFFAQGVEMSP